MLRLEMRIRQRRARPFIVMGVYAGVLSVAVLVVLLTDPASTGTSPSDLSRLGRAVFLWISVLQIAMVCLIVPAYSAAAISSERDRRSFDMLAMTLLPSWTIVGQKLTAALAEMVMLMVASLPVLAVVFMLGGVSPSEVIQVYLVLLTAAATYGALGVLCSCAFKDSRTCMFVAYLTTLALIAGVPIGLIFLDGVIHYQWLIGNVTITLLDWAIYEALPISFMLYGIVSGVLARFMRRRVGQVALFVGSYATVILAMAATGHGKLAFTSMPADLMEMFTVANPLRAVLELVDPSREPNELLGLVLASVGLSICYGYSCQWLAVRRFDRLRRS